MSACQIAQLTDRAVLKVAGADARRFLQGLVTSDMDRVGDGAAIHAALLTPQGKILFDFFVVEAGGAFLLDAPLALAGGLLTRLGFYRLRAAVELSDATAAHAVWVAWDGAPDTGAAVVLYPDPRLADLGWRLIAPAGADMAACGCAAAAEAGYHARRIGLGVPEGGRDFAYGDAFPHEADFDQLGGVDFGKGCFVGQEVVSRMQHRGTARKRIVPVEGEAALVSGAEVAGGGSPLGSLGSVAGRQGLALLRLDRAEEALAAGAPLTAGGVGISLRQPAWAGFKVPGA